mmetsp:Transcript_41877/g.58502  ORF Transcript_41877/g.58502 Transcript_41877/m.58502 type:complete len:297 (-) Transcript_41877:109-999(-)|eukprot:CAMPEP_0201492126 /NCGR_PEP_ID=MMETSP0151_2-20130828/32092_1 /ASSEMBLY_ACC=CAM_ASM_000257 /TAXON_ID=200890 /ORGANISM="Paramoeba atlantica, Strain 621/1 / CCAP 1560/9" /LENGTH=296 /DNA_ID=CAMNT_0047878793 /DNA_START=91 /DNA_END=981 /DNA_ORIENTATION=-
MADDELSRRNYCREHLSVDEPSTILPGLSLSNPPFGHSSFVAASKALSDLRCVVSQFVALNPTPKAKEKKKVKELLLELLDKNHRSGDVVAALLLEGGFGHLHLIASQFGEANDLLSFISSTDPILSKRVGRKLADDVVDPDPPSEIHVHQVVENGPGGHVFPSQVFIPTLKERLLMFTSRSEFGGFYLLSSNPYYASNFKIDIVEKENKFIFKGEGTDVVGPFILEKTFTQKGLRSRSPTIEFQKSYRSGDAIWFYVAIFLGDHLIGNWRRGGLAQSGFHFWAVVDSCSIKPAKG